MSKSCWCYTTDYAYLLPTLVSAIQLRKRLNVVNVDVIIILIGTHSDFTDEVKNVCNEENIILVFYNANAIDNSPMICARLFMNRMIDSKYEYMTYIDGDTQISGDLQGLSDAIPASGSLLASLDVMGVMVGDSRPLWRNCNRYFDHIGLPENVHRRYFNTGVIKVALTDWNVISKECLLLLKKSIATKYAFRDQDALNIILDGKQELISMRWNWPGFFANKGIDKIVSPNITHFMSKPRPWDGSFPPWGIKANAPYRDFIKSYPALSGLYRPIKGHKYIRYQIQQRWKSITEDYHTKSTHERIKAAEIGMRL